MSAARGRATVEDIDDDDPYAPYRPDRSSQPEQPEQTASASSSSGNAAEALSTASVSVNNGLDPQCSGNSSYTNQSSGSSSTRRLPSAADTYNASPMSEEQRSQTREAGDEEPLLGGRPFRESHTLSPSQPSSAEDLRKGGVNNEYLYAILNVPKDASADQIKDAYRSLAVMLHPDKHSDSDYARKKAAETQFGEVKRAYETLSDPEKRSVYDYFGEEGLNSVWSVSLRGKSPRDMQAEYERQRLFKQAADAEALVKSQGDFSAHINATSLFAPSSAFNKTFVPAYNVVKPVTYSTRLDNVKCTALVGKHSFETQLTDRTSVTLAGQMVSRNGMGGGNLLGTVKTQWHPRLYTSVSMAFLRPHIITTSGQYSPTDVTFFQWSVGPFTPANPPFFSVTYGQRLSQEPLTGFITATSGMYNIGTWGKRLVSGIGPQPPSVTVGLAGQPRIDNTWKAFTSISTADQIVTVDYTTRIPTGLMVRTGIRVGTMSRPSIFTSVQRKITENVRISLGLHWDGATSLRIKVNRLGQKITLPVTLAPNFRGDLILLFTALPIASYAALHHKYLEPQRKKRVTTRIEALRRANRDAILARRESALAALDVLHGQAVKKAKAELQKFGLVIVEAYYGRLDTFPPSALQDCTDVEREACRIWDQVRDLSSSRNTSSRPHGDLPDETYWDVRIPLQALLNKGQIIVPGGRTKSHLLGFYDPILGEKKKHLVVRYIYRGTLHQVTVQDFDDLAMPMRIHQV